MHVKDVAVDLYSLKCYVYNNTNLLIFKAETPADLDAISKWLDIAGNKLDYRRYGEVIIKAIALSLSYLSLATLSS